MKYISVAEAAKKWNVSERSVRNYCAQGKIPNAFLTGKTWNIPDSSEKPNRINQKSDAPTTLLEVLRSEKASKISGGIYHKVQIELTYNSNHIEGSRLTHDQTRYIFETNTIGMENGTLNVDDVVETANHFKCIDMVIDNAGYALSERFIKQLHAVLKSGTSDSRKDWFAVGEYKRLPNEVGGQDTVLPEEVSAKMRKLLDEYNSTKEKTLEDIIDFHYRFERIAVCNSTAIFILRKESQCQPTFISQNDLIGRTGSNKDKKSLRTKPQAWYSYAGRTAFLAFK